MKIKRFEASSMSEALRMIKKEFGEDAVILSAKSVKKSAGLLTGKQSQTKVVVTAAIDNPTTMPKDQTHRDHDSSLAAESVSSGDQGHLPQSKLQFLKRFNPITRTGQKKLHSKFVRLVSETSDKPKKEGLHEELVSQGVENTIAEKIEKEARPLISTSGQGRNGLRAALSQVIQAKEIVAPARHMLNTPLRIVVLVGPSGVGKTTMVAKLAAAQAKQAPGSVSFLSLDNQRVAGRAELERYASILGISLHTASDPDQLAPILEKTGKDKLVVVDTPGLGPEDEAQREHLRRMVDAIPGAEVHLLLNADARDSAMAKAISFFKPVGVHRLGFTRMDWGTTVGGLINQSIDSRLPVTYLSSTSDVTCGVEIATSDHIAQKLLPGTEEEPADSKHNEVPEKSSQSIYYVANRNSDIFHKKDCVSVKRINSDNMVVFHDPAEAMGLKFKPCRMCCGELNISKPIQRVAYKYASSR